MKFTKIFFTLISAVLAVTNGAAVPNLPKSYEGLAYLGGGVGFHAEETHYYGSSHRASWSAAERECREYTGGEGDLVSIESQEEDATLHNLIQSSSPYLHEQNLWTSGAYDSVARVWRWSSTGKPFEYTNWEGGEEPDFVPPTARVAFRSVDRFNYYWRMIADDKDHKEENFYICEVPPHRNDTPVPCKRENNLVIVLDGSSSIAAPDFVLGKHFSALLASAFDSPSRVSYIVYSSSSQVIFDLDNRLSATQINDTIRAAAQPASSTATNLAIDQAVAMLVLQPTDIPRKLVVLTDGQSDNPALTAAAAARAAAAGIRSFSVGIGSGIDQAELLTIANGDPDNRYTVATFDELIQVIAPVCVRVCAPWTPPNP